MINGHSASKFNIKQESIPLGCVPPAFLVLGRQTPLDADPLDAGHVACDAYWEADPPPPHPP